MSELEHAQFCAAVDRHRAFGATPREAFEQLMAQLTEQVSTPIVIWPYNRGDSFFSDAQQARLVDLRNRLDTLTESEREELERLIEESFDATIARTQSLSVVKS